MTAGTGIVYVVLWQDRHTDTTVHVFTDRDEASSWALQCAQDEASRAAHRQVTEEHTEGEVIAFCYSPEGDRLRVFAVQVDQRA